MSTQQAAEGGERHPFTDVRSFKPRDKTIAPSARHVLCGDDVARTNGAYAILLIHSFVESLKSSGVTRNVYEVAPGRKGASRRSYLINTLTGAIITQCLSRINILMFTPTLFVRFSNYSEVS